MNHIKISSDIKKIIGSYSLPSLEFIQNNKQNYLRKLKGYIINIGHCLDNNFPCTKYEYKQFNKLRYWVLR